MTGTLALGGLLVIAGIVLIRFRHGISRFQTDLNQSALPFLPELFTTVTPGGVVLLACVFFFLAALALVASLLGVAA